MPDKVERLITIAAPPERVWKAWVEEMNAWWTKPYSNDHDRVTGLLLEPRLGGRYIEKWGENGEGFLIGQVTEWLPPTRLAYTWSERSWGGAVTLVRLNFGPDGPGGTRLTYTHAGFERLPDGAAAHAGYDSGWSELSQRLKNFIEKGHPQ